MGKLHQPRQAHTSDSWRRLLQPIREGVPIVIRVTLADGSVLEIEQYEIVIDGPCLVLDAVDKAEEV